MRTQIAILAEVNDTLKHHYGTVDAFEADPIFILWAIQKLTDVAEAKAVIKKINNKRYKFGRVGIHVPYGHRFF